ncbi:tRNA (adenosine(37)-N6)-dimethylallyltransferase MiaA [Hydrogenimonas sp.]
MKIVAILGPTASGKTDLSLRLAKRHGCAILSLDSLAVYREIDIASAKPTPRERAGIPHFGIDALGVDEPFSVATFLELFEEARAFCQKEGRDLVIVGGTGFYLKALMEGISDIPPVDETVREEVAAMLRDLPRAYAYLQRVDPGYAARLMPTDRYRIEKALQLYLQSGWPPSFYFAEHPPRPLVETLPLFEIALEKERLWARIEKRTEKMLEAGLVDEVAYLEKTYGRAPNPMKAIGIAEVLDYFDGKLSYAKMQERIAIHTRQLAKRQRTFNRTQFPPHPQLSPQEAEREASKVLEG